MATSTTQKIHLYGPTRTSLSVDAPLGMAVYDVVNMSANMIRASRSKKPIVSLARKVTSFSFRSRGIFPKAAVRKVNKAPPEVRAETINRSGKSPPNQLGRALATAKIVPTPPWTMTAAGIPRIPKIISHFRSLTKLLRSWRVLPSDRRRYNQVGRFPDAHLDKLRPHDQVDLGNDDGNVDIVKQPHTSHDGSGIEVEQDHVDPFRMTRIEHDEDAAQEQTSQSLNESRRSCFFQLLHPEDVNQG